jgi:hypothetical protein
VVASHAEKVPKSISLAYDTKYSGSRIGLERLTCSLLFGATLNLRAPPRATSLSGLLNLERDRIYALSSTNIMVALSSARETNKALHECQAQAVTLVLLIWRSISPHGKMVLVIANVDKEWLSLTRGCLLEDSPSAGVRMPASLGADGLLPSPALRRRVR